MENGILKQTGTYVIDKTKPTIKLEEKTLMEHFIENEMLNK